MKKQFPICMLFNNILLNQVTNDPLFNNIHVSIKISIALIADLEKLGFS